MALGGATVFYAVTAPGAMQRPYGATSAGIVLGGMAFALMTFAALLGLRKRFLGLRLGRAQTWMRGHLWLGLLSFFLVLLHAGFHARGMLTLVLAIVAGIVAVSGVAGAALQHFMPRLITREVPLETIFEQIPHVREQLREEAQSLIAAAFAPAKAAAAAQAGAHAANDSSAVATFEDALQAEALQEFCEEQVSPFLLHGGADSALANKTSAEYTFRQMRTLLPARFHPTLAALESLTEEARQLSRQQTL
ncbi:MAG TPA: ferric reductase-like transmembrane domain-containing protein, partial [Terriglobales bacterium]|nr:ferric reductase-like transmembrane domain-containing protein [Terriglobales bacterium]